MDRTRYSLTWHRLLDGPALDKALRYGLQNYSFLQASVSERWQGWELSDNTRLVTFRLRLYAATVADARELAEQVATDLDFAEYKLFPA